MRAYHHTYGLNVTTSNCSNNYGPYQFPEKLIPLCLVNILEGKPLPIYGDGKQCRDWLFVDDHARGIELVIKNGRLGETYNIGGNNGVGKYRCCQSALQNFGPTLSRELSTDEALFSVSLLTRDNGEFPYHTCGRSSGHDTRYAVNPDKVASELGFSAFAQL